MPSDDKTMFGARQLADQVMIRFCAKYVEDQHSES